jgi:hypothetical protein
MLAKSAKIPQTLYIKITSYKIDLNFDSFVRSIFLVSFFRTSLRFALHLRLSHCKYYLSFFLADLSPPPHLRADSANIGEFWRIFHQSCRTPSTWRSSFLRHTYTVFTTTTVYIVLLHSLSLMVLKFCLHSSQIFFCSFPTKPYLKICTLRQNCGSTRIRMDPP